MHRIYLKMIEVSNKLVKSFQVPKVKSAWLKGTTSDCDFLHFYNEKSLSRHFEEKIETFLLKRGRGKYKSTWIWHLHFFSLLFTTAPFPINQLHFVTQILP